MLWHLTILKSNWDRKKKVSLLRLTVALTVLVSTSKEDQRMYKAQSMEYSLLIIMMESMLVHPKEKVHSKINKYWVYCGKKVKNVKVKSVLERLHMLQTLTNATLIKSERVTPMNPVEVKQKLLTAKDSSLTNIMRILTRA